MISIQDLAIAAIPMVLAITLHEASHGYVADKLGDPTARYRGRLTFNPIPHIDPVGTILVPALLFAFSGFIFGWAKPVPVDTRNFVNPRKDMAVVAAAGPLSNLLMAFCWLALAKVAAMFLGNSPIMEPIIRMAQIGLFFNIILMVLNLLPIPPLDGSRVLAWMVPTRVAYWLDRAEPYGFFILLGLLYVGLYETVIGPATKSNNRVLSGMRPTGRLHLGHYHGVLKNWVELQHSYECLFFAADWHALTTHYDNPWDIEQNTFDMVVDWLAAGVSPGSSSIFIQSRVPEHAELHLLLSMITPLGWLERVPTYKDQQEKLKEKDLATYGFLGYPLLQSADILVYRAGGVPVGEDQVAHVEITREVARRFNYIYGREPGFEDKAEAAIGKMGKRDAKSYRQHRKNYLEKGDAESLNVARALLAAQQNITMGDRERLFGYLEGSGKIILPEPQAMLTPASKMPGLDGQKMSKSYNNTIALRDDPDEVAKKL
ncbi:unnamed protein product, partial [Cyprideis torosa]